MINNQDEFQKKNNWKRLFKYVIVFSTISILLYGCGLGSGFSKEDTPSQGTIVEIDESSVEEPEVDLVQNILDGMTLEEKIGQMFIVGFDGYESNEDIKVLIEDKKVGGIILFSKNINTVAQTQELIKSLNDINSKNKLKLFVSLDEEGGVVSRIPSEMGSFESAWQVGAMGDVDYAYEHGRAIGKAVKSLGFNLDFAPVLDVNSNPNNPVIGTRAFSDNPEVVKTMGVAVFKGLKDSGVISVGKHFPGHGDTDVDSHYDVPIINKSIEELESSELIPFKYAIDEGIDMIMVGHLYLPNLDKEYIGTLSNKIVTGLLKNKLGFDGVVITDDMNMEGVKGNYTTRESAVKAIEAGNDIVLVSTGFQEQKSGIDGVLQAVKDGKITEKRIDESVYRIIKLKQSIK